MQCNELVERHRIASIALQRYPHWSRLFILAIAVWVSCLGVFQFADDPSQARVILADMILAKHFIAI